MVLIEKEFLTINNYKLEASRFAQEILGLTKKELDK